MEWRKVVAIIRSTVLEKVEERLRQLGVKGLTVTRVKGYGEYANLSKTDWLVDNARVEIFLAAQEVDAVVNALLDIAHVGAPGDGIVAVLPVEKLYRIRTKAEYKAPEA
jgi:nitrogen regulatory protein P-II 1